MLVDQRSFFPHIEIVNGQIQCKFHGPVLEVVEHGSLSRGDGSSFQLVHLTCAACEYDNQLRWEYETESRIRPEPPFDPSLVDPSDQYGDPEGIDWVDDQPEETGESMTPEQIEQYERQALRF